MVANGQYNANAHEYCNLMAEIRLFKKFFTQLCVKNTKGNNFSPNEHGRSQIHV